MTPVRCPAKKLQKQVAVKNCTCVLFADSAAPESDPRAQAYVKLKQGVNSTGVLEKFHPANAQILLVDLNEGANKGEGKKIARLCGINPETPYWPVFCFFDMNGQLDPRRHGVFVHDGEDAGAAMRCAVTHSSPAAVAGAAAGSAEETGGGAKAPESCDTAAQEAGAELAGEPDQHDKLLAHLTNCMSVHLVKANVAFHLAALSGKRPPKKFTFLAY